MVVMRASASDGRSNTATADPTDRRVSYRKQWVVVIGKVVWAGMNLVRYPGVNFSILIKNTGGTNQACCIEDVTGPFRIDFEHRAALDVDVVLFGFLLEPLRMLVGYLNRELVDQFRGCFEHRRRVCEFRKHDEAHGQKWRRSRDGRVDHRKHAIRVRAHCASIEWIREICLATRNGVSNMVHLVFSPAILSTYDVTTRVLYVSRYFCLSGVRG